MIVALLAAHGLVMAVVIARAHVIIVFGFVVVAVSVCMFKLHLRLNSDLYSSRRSKTARAAAFAARACNLLAWPGLMAGRPFGELL